MKAEREERTISIRLPESDVALIDRAAGLRGRSRTDFMREAAVRAAEEVVRDSTVVHMSARSFAAFRATLAERAQPVPELVDVFKRKAPWEPGRAQS